MAIIGGKVQPAGVDYDKRLSMPTVDSITMQFTLPDNSINPARPVDISVLRKNDYHNKAGAHLDVYLVLRSIILPIVVIGI